MSAWFERFTGLSLLDPWLLALLLALPVALMVRGLRGKPSIVFAPGGFLTEGDSGLPKTLRVRLAAVPLLLQGLGWVGAVIALARPIERVELPVETSGIDILLVLDISSSMTANDMDRNRTRLEVAKDAAAKFVEGRTQDRIGLICFARYPDVRCPLTLDHRALGEILAGVSLVQNEGPEDATGIGTAVARGAQLLRESEAKSHVMILLTDGEENVAHSENQDEIAPSHAAQLCEGIGVRVYTVAAGIGSPDPSGKWRPPDTTQVRGLAETTGGVFYEARDAGAVAGVYRAIDALEKAELAQPRIQVRERFLPFLLGAFLLFLAGQFLQATVFEELP